MKQSKHSHKYYGYLREQLALYKKVRKDLKPFAAKTRSPVLVSPAIKPKKGQVWITKQTNPNFPVGASGPKTMILTSVIDECLRGVPVSQFYGLASNRDLIVFENMESVFGFNPPYMIETWADILVFPTSLEVYLGEIPEVVLSDIKFLISWHRNPKEGRCKYSHAIKAQEDKGPILECWKIEDGREIVVGQMIGGKKDPRIEFEALELKDLEYLQSAAVVSLNL